MLLNEANTRKFAMCTNSFQGIRLNDISRDLSIKLCYNEQLNGSHKYTIVTKTCNNRQLLESIFTAKTTYKNWKREQMYNSAVVYLNAKLFV